MTPPPHTDLFLHTNKQHTHSLAMVSVAGMLIQETLTVSKFNRSTDRPNRIDLVCPDPDHHIINSNFPPITHHNHNSITTTTKQGQGLLEQINSGK
jgi:hypothetical protein